MCDYRIKHLTNILPTQIMHPIKDIVGSGGCYTHGRQPASEIHYWPEATPFIKPSITLCIHVAKYTDQRYSNILTQIQPHKLKTIQDTN